MGKGFSRFVESYRNSGFRAWLGKLSEEMAHHKVLWLFLLIFSAMSVYDIAEASVYDIAKPVRVMYVSVIAILKATLATLVYTLCNKRLYLKIPCVILIGIYIFLSLLNFTAFQLYGFGITRKLILIFAQTTPAETAGFMPELVHNILLMFRSWIFYLILALLLLAIYFIRKCGKKTFIAISLTGSALGIVGFLVFNMVFSMGRTAHLLFARLAKYSYEVVQEDWKFKEMLKNKKELPDAASVSSLHIANTVIVVIGESAIRTHHSLYGYPLPTTPRLDALSDSLYVFRDAIGSSLSTSGNMERILSFKKDDKTSGDGLDYPLLVDYFNRAGYKTFWLSNQERYGSMSNTSGVMAMNSSVTEYVGANNSEDALCMKFDEALLPEIEKALKDTVGNKLIFAHLMGSHSEYKLRYPESFRIFSAESELKAFNFDWLDPGMARRRAEYDNSIRYTDTLLAEIIRKVSSLKESAIMIYLSDHGCTVYDSSAYNGRDDSCAQVPFILYANSEYRRSNPGIIDRIQQALSKPFSTANLVHSLLTLTGSGYSYYDPKLDVLSPEFEIRPRYVDEKIWSGERKAK